MTEDEAYKVHIQYTFNAFCKIVIRHAAISKVFMLRRKWERDVSFDYLMNEKFVQFAAWEPDEEYLFRRALCHYHILRQSVTSHTSFNGYNSPFQVRIDFCFC